MHLKKLFTLALISALALSLTACGDKKPAASASPAASAFADKGKVSEEVKGVVATAPEYKEFDEANQCWVVKSGADKYCLAPYGSNPDTLFCDGNKTKLTMVLLQSKGKLVNGQLDEHTDGGVAAVVVDKDGQPYAKMPFTKLWATPKMYGKKVGKWAEHSVMGGRTYGKDLKGFWVDDTQIIEWPDENPGEHHDNLRRAKTVSRVYYVLDGKDFRQVGKVRIAFTDSKIPYSVNINPSFGAADEATGYNILNVKLLTSHQADAFKDKTFDVKYDPAKKAYDFPQELRKIMKE